MKTTLKLSFITLLSASIFACAEDTPEPIVPLEAILVEDLAAPNDVINRNTGEVTEVRPFQFFSLEENALVEETEDWDLAFKGTTIRVNATKNVTAAVVTGIFDEIAEVPTSATFATDSGESFAIPTGSGNGWYNYNSATFTVTPIPGRVLLVKTTHGNYAKIEILSYYKGNPPAAEIDPMSTPSAHYTFRYILQPNGTTTF
ncbi:HmuY family protein [Algoriphagus boritolerans]|uniref:HmuY protein n=1 Tax=Algoriphagus boritolerans DSM 17298 = JCM 18970 TaxID=1120964 RepID=A0A1H5SSC8_9BACT|nr:HmuY family protein [Algoriphagus boritolerans]SEF53513.1 HmuY protein [Algoriphagus boritolerans DSM 17298 = JCM 18970]